MAHLIEPNLNKFRLATIHIKVKNLGKSLNYMTNILGFGINQIQFSEFGIKAFLYSNFRDVTKSIQFCIEQEFYGNYIGDIKFGLKPIDRKYFGSLLGLCLDGFNLSDYEYNDEHDTIRHNSISTEFKDIELENFIVENKTWIQELYKKFIKFEPKSCVSEYDYLFNEKIEFIPFCDSYLKEIRIKVDSIERYKDVFIQLGFNVLPIEVDNSGVRNMQVVLNDQCEINLRLIETRENLVDLNIMDIVSFEIVSDIHCKGEGSTFKCLSDLGYCFSNEVFDEDDNLIANYAELVAPDRINWRITE